MLAYHVIVHALEAQARWTPIGRFASSVRHALNGHLPYDRFHNAGVARERESTGEDTLDRIVHEWLATDLNPLTQLARLVSRPSTLLSGFNAYTGSVNLGIKSQVVLSDARESAPTSSVKPEISLVAPADPAPCRHARYVVFEQLMLEAVRNSRCTARPQYRRMSDVGRLLGIERSAAMDVALLLEDLGQVPVSRIASELGCHKRTLERRLREEGVTAEMLRQIARLEKVADAIGSGATLAHVAADAGFSDHAHMTRSFRASCGMSPSFFRKILIGSVTPAASC